ncbi:MAG: hypothetical protein BM564_04670 [Bacteroidetes bacterium MedPE-SWsnd-G2]|nr:MAG: hypothetical protein BM564_04670 [Bacteroidetes bacterium MedPE-SWsnd-G2]
MKKNYAYIILFLFVGSIGFSQNTVTVDGSGVWIGYANVFDLPADGGGYQFGSGWALGDIKSTVDAGSNTVTLQPNYNTYNATDAYWTDPVTLEGNKTFEGNTYLEDDTLAGSDLTFTGNVSSYTIDGAYSVIAFIKVFNADYSVLKQEDVPLVDGMDFSVVYTNVEAGDAHVQYGFQVLGPNANPTDEAALGSVVVEAVALSLDDVVKADSFKLFPNPSSSELQFNASQVVDHITIYDVLGKQVSAFTPNATSDIIEIENLPKGIYLMRVSIDNSVRTERFVKN